MQNREAGEAERIVVATLAAALRNPAVALDTRRRSRGEGGVRRRHIVAVEVREALLAKEIIVRSIALAAGSARENNHLIKSLN